MLLGLAACSRPADPGPRKYAVLPFDNQTGDSQREWLGSAVARIAATQASAQYAPLLQDAQTAQATHYVHGYVTQAQGKLLVQIQIEDAATHKMVQTLALEGGPLAMADHLAKALAPQAKPFSTANDPAAEAWARGEFEKATTLDPDFGLAWLGLVEASAARKDQPAALAAAEKALARTGLRSPVDRARLELALANLHQDPAGQSKALQNLAQLQPGNPEVLEASANAAFAARQFAAAAQSYRALAKADPASTSALNQLGYSLALNGDLEAALKAFEEYGHAPGQEANALDSAGEALFLHGKFAEAEERFLAAHEKNPRMLQGSDLVKAAYAHWLAGDLPGADKRFAQFAALRQKAGDATLPWREAVWLYATGRVPQAQEKLQGAPAELARKQNEVWNNLERILPKNPAQVEPLYRRSNPSTDGLARILYAHALFAAAQPDLARPLLKYWPLPEAPDDPLLQSLIFPLYLELKKK